MSYASPVDLTLIVAFAVAVIVALIGLFKPEIGAVVTSAAAPGSGGGSGGEPKPPLTLLQVGLLAGSVLLGLIVLRECYLLLAANSGMGMPTYQIVRMTIGLGAGFIAAGLAGGFTIDGSLSNVSIKAGGPTGVAIFFYLVNPMNFTPAG